MIVRDRYYLHVLATAGGIPYVSDQFYRVNISLRVSQSVHEMTWMQRGTPKCLKRR